QIHKHCAHIFITAGFAVNALKSLVLMDKHTPAHRHIHRHTHTQTVDEHSHRIFPRIDKGNLGVKVIRLAESTENTILVAIEIPLLICARYVHKPNINKVTKPPLAYSYELKIYFHP